ncbi:MAG: lamin tail domain-containing protein, partial [Candidatus Thermoplasmatota archaeon]|nr:lamin tail domain-containing protein [Candidatus Thermoplasmatota archaeon]
IQTYIPDLIHRKGDDMLRIIVCTDRFGPSISFGIRVARLSDGSWDVLANGTISHRETTVEVLVDPLMCIMRRFVEVHCKGRAWGMDILVPEVEPYDLAEASTSDIPGIGAFLSNVPIPVLGLSASVEAGMRLKYSPPFPTDVVVNEFEPNPKGEDSGEEWVELYNPLAQPRCVDGWRLATVHGGQKEMAISGTIPANGLMVVTFAETSIDNGIPGDPFNDGDAIVLIDAGGVTVDTTPVQRDSANDERTWQRTWDGGPRWAFTAGGKGVSNGPPVMLASGDFIAKALFEALKQAFVDTQLQEVSASLDFVAMFAKRVLNNLIENLLGLIGEIIHEVIFYVKVMVSDVTGSGSVGFRASFVVTGEAIVDLVRWLIFNLATFIVNLGRANNPIAYPAFPTSIFSGLFLRFELLFEVGLPRMVRAIGAIGPLDQEYACAVSISPNIPALGKLAGKSWGSWCVEFGIYLEGVPRQFAKGMLSKGAGDAIDFWVVKARAYSV